jgi:predicted nucleic acid-binding Zn ribbon protein
VANSGSDSQTPLEIAEAGGRHSGFLKQRLGKTADELQHEATTLRRRAAEHSEKIANRIGYNSVSDDPVIQARAEAGRMRHLQREIENFTEQAELCEELASRKNQSPS